MWASHRTDDVVSRLHIRHPITNRLRRRIFQGARTCLYRADLCTQQLHAGNVGCLSLNVQHAHVNNAIEAKASADRCCRHTVLTRTSLSNNPFFAHSQRQHGLSQGIIDFVSPCMIQVFALEINLSPTVALRQALGEIERAGATDKVTQMLLQLRLKIRISFDAGKSHF